MMSFRTLVHTAPRLGRSIATKPLATRPSASLLRSSQRMTPARSQLTSAFSTSVFRKQQAGLTDEELSEKLATEIQFEAEIKDTETRPASIQDFLNNGPFKIQDTAGREDVVLTRDFGSEKITVTFSIADLANYDPDMYEDDGALADEEAAEAAPSSQGGGAAGAAENEELDEEDMGGAEAAVPCRLNVVVEKAGKGALSVQATAQDGNIVVENLSFYKDAAMAHSRGASEAATDNVYPGPPFGSLDEDLQLLVERYLEERGISQALAVFVPDYMEVKEQKEYLTWLNGMKEFVDA